MPIRLPLRSVLSAFAPLAATILVGLAAIAYLSYFNSYPEVASLTVQPETPIMAAIAPLKVLTVAALSKHTATVIFVHGLGDSGHG